MAGECHQTTLDQLGRIVTGKTPQSRHPEYFGGEIPFVTPTDFDGRRSIEFTERCLTERGASVVNAARIPREAIMVSCIGSDMGKSAIAGKACVTNQQINSVLVESPNNPLFVYYNLSMRKEEIRAAAGGSAQPILNKTSFGQLDILLFPIPEQRAIAHILGTLDDKIELNRRMNETLEAMAKALFKSWFVDFDPVRAKAEGRPTGLPAEISDLFPDSFEDSELGKIPKGWDVRELGDLSIISGGKQLSSELIYEDGLIPVYGANGIMGYSSTYNKNGFVIIFGRVGAYCGSVFWEYDGAWVNNNASSVIPLENKEYILQAMLNQDYSSLKSGSAQPFIANSALSALKFISPSYQLCSFFTKLIKLFYKQQFNNLKLSKIFKNLRDTLLPKLISGELRVPDAEKILEEIGV